MDEVYYQYNPWWEGSSFNSNLLKPRTKRVKHIAHTLEKRRVVFLTGIRRVGKSSLMKLLVHHLMQSGTDPKCIFYVSMDDYLLRQKSIVEVVEDFRRQQL